ncbi:phosphotransferase [Vibrio sp. RE86]|uniref:phosphotransferase n=1 Tax=Vibrio sp. RE86 TaxID=2607605 RepID=UPI001493849E|nr:phosphotransferase [Vibrio sp. RE86]NOH78243.1 phosphotransferase [Vibrio sp. RE86]
MNQYDYQALVESLGYQQLESVEVLQTLWGGYGELVRLYTDNSSVIVKHILLPKPEHHPKGWNSELSHQRKLRSYQVELNWYQQSANQCLAKVPRALKVAKHDQELLVVMEDLKQAGFSEVVKQAEPQHLDSALRWLAYFHAQHIGDNGTGLWESGTYWHLATRPDELESLDDKRLKSHAEKIDRVLTQTPYQTLVHGDGKLANFCFTPDGTQAAAVDFQYIGRGCAMKDVALFMSSAIEPEYCEEQEAWVLDSYFKHLRLALKEHQPQLNVDDVEQAWRPMFAIAWADFQRFVKGWSPNHWKINPYTEKLTLRALELLKAYP